jgi:hypothetical protein
MAIVNDADTTVVILDAWVYPSLYLLELQCRSLVLLTTTTEGSKDGGISYRQLSTSGEPTKAEPLDNGTAADRLGQSDQHEVQASGGSIDHHKTIVFLESGQPRDGLELGAKAFEPVLEVFRQAGENVTV